MGKSRDRIRILISSSISSSTGIILWYNMKFESRAMQKHIILADIEKTGGVGARLYPFELVASHRKCEH